MAKTRMRTAATASSANAVPIDAFASIHAAVAASAMPHRSVDNGQGTTAAEPPPHRSGHPTEPDEIVLRRVSSALCPAW